MNKTDLLVLLERRLGSRGAAVAALDAVLDEVQRAVAAGDRVTLTGFGTFERADRPARTGRNPRTGEALEIAASAVPRFHPGAVLRSVVAGKTVLGPRPEPLVVAVAPRRTAAAPSASAAPAQSSSGTTTDVPRAKAAAKPGKSSTKKSDKKSDKKSAKPSEKKSAKKSDKKSAKPSEKKSGKKK